MSETDLKGWLTKREAAARLGVAEKTLERMSKRGEVQQATRKRPGSPGEVVYHPGDVERIAAEMSKPPAPFVMPDNAPQNALVRSEPAAASHGQQLTFAAMADMLRPAADRVRITERLFLTIDEAAEYSGLPKSYIREQVSARGSLACEREPGGASVVPIWRRCKGGGQVMGKNIAIAAGVLVLAVWSVAQNREVPAPQAKPTVHANASEGQI